MKFCKDFIKILYFKLAFLFFWVYTEYRYRYNRGKIMNPQIGTILTDVSPITNLKHFIVYDISGKGVWATDGFNNAEIVKKCDDYFVIWADGEYRAYHCEEVNRASGLYNFHEGSYKSYLDYYEIVEFEKTHQELINQNTENGNTTTKTKLKSETDNMEEFKIEVERELKKMENRMRDTINKYNEAIENNKKDYEDTLAKYRKMNNLDSVIEYQNKNKQVIQSYKEEVASLWDKIFIQKDIIIEWQEKTAQKESTINSLNGKISELQMAVANYEKNNENIIESMAQAKAKEKVEKMQNVIIQKENDIKALNIKFAIMFAVNVFLLLILAYAVTLIK